MNCVLRSHPEIVLRARFCFVFKRTTKEATAPSAGPDTEHRRQVQAASLPVPLRSVQAAGGSAPRPQQPSPGRSRAAGTGGTGGRSGAAASVSLHIWRGSALPPGSSPQPLQQHSPMAGKSVPRSPGESAARRAGPPPASRAAGAAGPGLPTGYAGGSCRLLPWGSPPLPSVLLAGLGADLSASQLSLPVKLHRLINYTGPSEGPRAARSCFMRMAHACSQMAGGQQTRKVNLQHA